MISCISTLLMRFYKLPGRAHLIHIKNLLYFYFPLVGLQDSQAAIIYFPGCPHRHQIPRRMLSHRLPLLASAAHHIPVLYRIDKIIAVSNIIIDICVRGSHILLFMRIGTAKCWLLIFSGQFTSLLDRKSVV